MEHRQESKLRLEKETLRILSVDELDSAKGGMMKVSTGTNCETDPTYDPTDTNCVPA